MLHCKIGPNLLWTLADHPSNYAEGERPTKLPDWKGEKRSRETELKKEKVWGFGFPYSSGSLKVKAEEIHWICLVYSSRIEVTGRRRETRRGVHSEAQLERFDANITKKVGYTPLPSKTPVFRLPMGERTCWTSRVNAGMPYRNGILMKKARNQTIYMGDRRRKTDSLWELVDTGPQVIEWRLIS